MVFVRARAQNPLSQESEPINSNKGKFSPKSRREFLSSRGNSSVQVSQGEQKDAEKLSGKFVLWRSQRPRDGRIATFNSWDQVVEYFQKNDIKILHSHGNWLHLLGEGRKGSYILGMGGAHPFSKTTTSLGVRTSVSIENGKISEDSSFEVGVLAPVGDAGTTFAGTFEAEGSVVNANPEEIKGDLSLNQSVGRANIYGGVIVKKELSSGSKVKVKPYVGTAADLGRGISVNAGVLSSDSVVPFMEAKLRRPISKDGSKMVTLRGLVTPKGSSVEGAYQTERDYLSLAYRDKALDDAFSHHELNGGVIGYGRRLGKNTSAVIEANTEGVAKLTFRWGTSSNEIHSPLPGSGHVQFNPLGRKRPRKLPSIEVGVLSKSNKISPLKGKNSTSDLNELRIRFKGGGETWYRIGFETSEKDPSARVVYYIDGDGIKTLLGPEDSNSIIKQIKESGVDLNDVK